MYQHEIQPLITTERAMALGGIKHDSNKPRVDLIPPSALNAAGRAFDYGARKYSPWNWTKGLAFLRLYGAAIRHLSAWMAGEERDPESGLSHLDHALATVMMLQAHAELGLGEDDRPTTLKAAVSLEEALNIVAPGSAEPKRTRFWKMVWEDSGDELSMMRGRRYCSAEEALNQAAAWGYDITPRITFAVKAVECDA